jgi:hypothetical protein
MLKNKNGFQVNISLSIFFIAFCDLFTVHTSYQLLAINHGDIVEWNKKINKISQIEKQPIPKVTASGLEAGK